MAFPPAFISFFILAYLKINSRSSGRSSFFLIASSMMRMFSGVSMIFWTINSLYLVLMLSLGGVYDFGGCGFLISSMIVCMMYYVLFFWNIMCPPHLTLLRLSFRN